MSDYSASWTPTSVETIEGAAVAANIVRDLNALDHLRDLWDMWNEHPNTDLDFFRMIVARRPEILRPHVMVLGGGGAQSLLVGRIEEIRPALRLGYLTILRPKVRALTLPFGGLLGDYSQESCNRLVDEVMNTLRRREADVAIFEPLRVGSPLHRAVLGRPGSWCLGLESSQLHRWTDIPEDVESFYQGLSPKVRRNLRWQAKKLHTDFGGDVRVSVYSETKDLPELFEKTEIIAKMTYQRGLGVGFGDSPEMRARMQLEADKGWLRAYVLHLAGKPAAFWIGSIYRGTFHSNFMGYDAAYAKNSPGMYLVMHVIESLCSEHPDRVRQIDFGLGDAQYKQVLATEVWQETGIWIYAPTLKGGGLRILRALLGNVDHLLRRVLEGMGLQARLKKLWRRTVRRSASA